MHFTRCLNVRLGRTFRHSFREKCFLRRTCRRRKLIILLFSLRRKNSARLCLQSDRSERSGPFLSWTGCRADSRIARLPHTRRIAEIGIPKDYLSSFPAIPRISGRRSRNNALKPPVRRRGGFHHKVISSHKGGFHPHEGWISLKKHPFGCFFQGFMV